MLGTAFKVFLYKKLAVWAIVINFVCALLCLGVGQNVPNAPLYTGANTAAMPTCKVQATNAKPPISNERENKKHT